MSSTVGYGVEVSGEFFGEAVTGGDFEMLVDEKFPFLQVVQSRAEYGDEVRTFLFIKSSIVKAGGKGTAAALSLIAPAHPHPSNMQVIIIQSQVTVISPEGWYLVDYYVYS